MTRERWLALQAEALARDGHRCQLALDGCTGTASMVVVERSSRPEPLTLDRLTSACPACHDQRHPEPTPEQQLAEQLEDVADETVYYLHEFDAETGEVIATGRVTRRALASLTIKSNERRDREVKRNEKEDDDR